MNLSITLQTARQKIIRLSQPTFRNLQKFNKIQTVKMYSHLQSLITMNSEMNADEH